MLTQRSSGILAHITSLPGPFGIGDLGEGSYRFIDFLFSAGQRFWQILPTCPTKAIFDHSPYMSTSAFAGSPLLLSPQLLIETGLLSSTDLEGHDQFSPYFVEFEKVVAFKEHLYRLAYNRFQEHKTALHSLHEELALMQKNTTWLLDHALFMALKKVYCDAPWCEWPQALRNRDPEALAQFTNENEELVGYYQFEQFLFKKEWQALHDYANNKGVLLFGDLPIYVSYDSVDVWANQDIFLLDPASGKPHFIAGVPPDYFAANGQRWGNPLYDWQSESVATQNALLSWWTDRLSSLFTMVDVARIDHFRAFSSYWAIPESEPTAINGAWQPGPGKAFFEKIFARLGRLPIIAEDLGIITPEVEQLRDALDFPGMKVLQFAFDGNPDNTHLPYNFQSANCVAYTGTHDNDTTVGWFLSNQLNDAQRNEIKRFANREPDDNRDIHGILLYLAMSSIANIAIFPLQDALGFGNDCRMNTPGTSTGNWRWRCAEEYLSDGLSAKIHDLTRRFGRLPE